MLQKALPDDTDTLLAALERLPIDALEIIQSFVAEMIDCADDDDRRKEALSAATARISALRSV